MSGARRELFLSYGREPEVVSFVTQLKHDLEHHGYSVWLDREDIPAGSDWHGAIGTGLDQCRALIAVVTHKYISSRYCTSELYTANSDQKLIFPVIFEDIDFSVSEKARGVKYVISGINWTMFRPGVDDYYGSLVKLIQGMKDLGLGPGTGVGFEETDVGDVSGKISQLHLSPGTQQAPRSTSPGPYGFQSPSPTPHPSAPPITTYTSPYGNCPPHHTPPHPHTSPGYPPGSPYHYQYPSQYATPPHMQAHGYYLPATPPHPTYSTPHPTYSSPPHPTYSSPPHPTYPTPPHPTYPTPPHPTYPTPPHPTYSSPPTTVSPQGVGPDPPPNYSELYPRTTGQTTPQDVPPVPVTRPPPPPPPRPTFKVGMKLEAVDRRFPYFVCVATIMDRTDNTVMIHFDGWSQDYNYWCPSDSVELHPVGWCEKHGWELQPPYGSQDEWSSWKHYLSQTDAEAADESFFNEVQLAPPGSLLFKPGMRLEAKDRQNPHLICVATVTNTKDGQLLIHFDGWSNTYDYWCKPDSTDIHPAMWCGKRGQSVQPPRDHTGVFKWSIYLANPSINPAPAHLFTEEQRGDGTSSKCAVGGFKVGMKLEAKDRLHPTLVCVATIADIKDEQLLIHFDGWSMDYDYWCRPDSTDIHPRGWCSSHGMKLQAPAGKSASSFRWDRYLQQCGGQTVPNSAFTSAQKK